MLFTGKKTANLWHSFDNLLYRVITVCPCDNNTDYVGMLWFIHLLYFYVLLLQGAERKNKDETKSVERRLQKFIKAHQGSHESCDTNIYYTHY